MDSWWCYNKKLMGTGLVILHPFTLFTWQYLHVLLFTEIAISSHFVMVMSNSLLSDLWDWTLLILSTISVHSFHVIILITYCMTFLQKRRWGTLALCQERMYALRAGLIKNATSKRDSTNANLSESTNVFHCSAAHLQHWKNI